MRTYNNQTNEDENIASMRYIYCKDDQEIYNNHGTMTRDIARMRNKIRDHGDTLITVLAAIMKKLHILYLAGGNTT